MTTHEQRKQLGDLVVAKRTAAPFKWNQKQLADEAGINGGYLSLIESGQRAPSIRTLHKLRRALRLTESEFVHWLSILDEDPKAAA